MSTILLYEHIYWSLYIQSLIFIFFFLLCLAVIPVFQNKTRENKTHLSESIYIFYVKYMHVQHTCACCLQRSEGAISSSGTIFTRSYKLPYGWWVNLGSSERISALNNGAISPILTFYYLSQKYNNCTLPQPWEKWKKIEKKERKEKTCWTFCAKFPIEKDTQEMTRKYYYLI